MIASSPASCSKIASGFVTTFTVTGTRLGGVGVGVGLAEPVGVEPGFGEPEAIATACAEGDGWSGAGRFTKSGAGLFTLDGDGAAFSGSSAEFVGKNGAG